MDLFKNGIDVYIQTAKTYLGDAAWDKLTDKEKKKWRKNFKTVFLGILYGLGKQSLAERLNCTVEEAERVIQGVFTAYPELEGYIKSQQAYPYNHNGCLNTMLGDRIVPDEWKYYNQAKTKREITKIESRLNRLAVNLVIQGGTSTIMSSGFFNDLRCAREEDWTLTSFITVHDSNTCNFSADKLWYVKSFYDKNFTQFCHNKSKLTLLFDLMVGVNYQDVCEFKQISDNLIELKGTARSILQIMDAMDECPGLLWEADHTREEIVPKYVEHPIQRFILEKGASMVLDQSKYKVQFIKLN